MQSRRNVDRLFGLRDVCRIEVQHIPRRDADLVIFERGHGASFDIRRVFTVHAHAPTVRGRHAHRQCQQVMICLAGVCDVLVDDGADRKTIKLDQPMTALYVPPSIWAEQRYQDAQTILMVVCDREYEEDDCIRDYDAFLAYRNAERR
jgi:dTDP-4-dehydrorhamnose 3,5-epimerase-like enzyme